MNPFIVGFIVGLLVTIQDISDVHDE